MPGDKRNGEDPKIRFIPVSQEDLNGAFPPDGQSREDRASGYLPKHSKPTKKELKKAAQKAAPKAEKKPKWEKTADEREKRPQPMNAKQPAKPERPAKSERPVRPEQSANAEQAAKSERPAKPEQPVRPEQSANVEQAAKAERPAKSEWPVKLERPARPEQSAHAEQAAKSERPAKAQRSAKPERPVKFERSAKAKPAPKAKKSKAAQPQARTPKKDIAVYFRKAKSERPENGEMTVIRGGRKGSGLLRLLIAAAAIAVLLLVLNIAIPVGLVEYTGNFFAGLGGGGGFPVAVSSSASRNIAAAGSDIALLEDSSLLLYKDNGRVIFNRQHGYANPALSASGSRVLVYDRGGSGFRVENRARTLIDQTVDNEIITADIAECGAFAVVTRSDKYVCDVAAYSAKGEQKMLWHSAGRQVVSVTVSENGRFMAVGTLSSEGGQYVSGIILFRIGDGATLFEQSYEGSVVISLDFKGSYVVGVFDHMLSSLRINGERTDFVVESGTISCFSNVSDWGVAITLEKFNNTLSDQLLVFDKKLTQTGAAELGASVVSISMRGSKTAVLMREELASYDQKGERRKSRETGADAKLVAWSGAGAAILQSSSLELLKI